MLSTSCQRWKERRERYRPVGEPFDPKRHTVELIGRKPAREFDSGSYPTNRLNVGIFRSRLLAGVAVFGVPARSSVAKRTGGGAQQDEGADLARFVLLDEVEANAETWFLARAFRLAEEHIAGLRAVLAYSDPHPRTSTEGLVVMPGHVGTIYQAHNGRFVGRSSSRTMWLGPDGREIPPRSLSKLRMGERGDDAVYAAFRAFGAPARRPFEEGHEYVIRALREGPFRAELHPGCYCYVWPLDRSVQRALPEPKLYPKKAA